MTVAAGVKALHKSYEQFAPVWQRARDVCAGQDAIHAGGTLYLDKLDGETSDEFNKRVRRTPFFNASWRTVASFVGMLYRKPPTVDVPANIEPMLEDVTLSGVSFDMLAQDVALEGLITSRVGVLVDYPKSDVTQRTRTQAQAEREGLRPSMTMYRTEAIRNWRFERRNNRSILTQVRLTEYQTTPTSEFEEERIAVIRVLDLDENGIYRSRLFKEENEEEIGEAVYPVMNGKTMSFIPFYFITPDGTGAEVSEPVLIDLFNHNLKHYMVSADYEHACHMTALPTAYITGHQPQYDDKGKEIPSNLKIGSTTVWLLPHAESKVDFLEFEGAGIGALKENLVEKKDEMAAIGARAITPDKAAVEAAQTLILRNVGEHSILAAVAVATSSGLTEALNVFCEWGGAAYKSIYEINRDFMPVAVDPANISAWLSLVQAGQLSSQSLFNLMKRGDLIEHDVTFEDEQARVETSPPMPPPMAPKPGEDEEDDKDDK